MSSFSFQGKESFAVSAEKLWEFLSDLRNVPRCLPSLQDVQYPSENILTAKLTPNFPFIKGSLTLKVEIKERQAPTHARIEIFSQGMGGRATIDSSLELQKPNIAPTSTQTSTSLLWKADAKLEGLWGAVSQGLVEGAARKIMSEAFDAVRRELSQ